MDFFNVLTFIGGISLFLFGMNIMGKALEKRAGGKLKSIINKMTTNKFTGLMTGLGVTAIIQSSSATTVMVVGFVNSGIMNLGQAVNVIMGANIGTTITSWILSLAGLSSSNFFVKLLKPSSFSPVLALIGVILYMFFKDDKKKDTGLIFLGFATLMFGMETMSSSVSGLKNEEWFRNLFIMFNDNPLLGVLIGAMVTAIIQSSSASVGILQAFATTGQISFGSAIPIILGQNIGTCVTALISSIGTNRNAKRASLVHLFFNLIGTVVVMIVYILVKLLLKPVILSQSATMVGIAIIHTSFNIICVLLLLPFSKLLEKLVCAILKDREDEKIAEIDERLLLTPSIALEQVRLKIVDMGKDTECALMLASDIFASDYNFEKISFLEGNTDHYEDLIGSYLIKLSSKELEEKESEMTATYLKIIGDLERIGDHSLNISKTRMEIDSSKIVFSEEAVEEVKICFAAIKEIWETTYNALVNFDETEAKKVEPLEQVIDNLVRNVKNNHIIRLQMVKCSIDKGFVLADLLSNIERISDHCSNIAGYIIDSYMNDLNSHHNILSYRNNEDFVQLYKMYSAKYSIVPSVSESAK